MRILERLIKGSFVNVSKGEKLFFPPAYLSGSTFFIIPNEDKELELRQYMKLFYIVIILYILIFLMFMACIFLEWLATLFSVLAIFMMVSSLFLLNWHKDKISSLTKGLTIKYSKYY